MPRKAQTATTQARLTQWVGKRLKASRLIEPGQRVLVALSGGPDSVALLAVLHELAPAWRLTLSAIHVNYGLRGEESEEDARFAARFCDRLKVPLHCERIALGAGRETGSRSSLQERAREARYSVFTKVGQTVAADRIALGHQADDQAETLLMWMVRGAGTSGLAGIPPIRESLFVRPLLGIARDKILEYLWSRDLPFRLDSSNAKPLYLRNRIRHELLPALKRLNPSLVESLARQADILREEDAYLNQLTYAAMTRLVRHTNAGVLVDRDGLLAQPVPLQRRLLRLVLQGLHPRGKGPTFATVAAVLDTAFHGKSGTSCSVKSVVATREYGTIRLQASPPAGSATRPRSPERVTLSVPGSIRWPWTGQELRATVASRPVSSRQVPTRTRVCFDADRLSTPLTVRPWLPGDAFQPAGMGGRTKKLQDYFSDIKLPRQDRRLVPVVQAREGILWVAGHRADHRFRAGAGTQRTLVLELLDAPTEGEPN